MLHNRKWASRIALTSFVVMLVVALPNLGQTQMMIRRPPLPVQPNPKGNAEGFSSVRITENGNSRSFETKRDPLADLEELMARYRYVPLPDEPRDLRARFAGGAVGTIDA